MSRGFFDLWPGAQVPGGEIWLRFMSPPFGMPGMRRSILHHLCKGKGVGISHLKSLGASASGDQSGQQNIPICARWKFPGCWKPPQQGPMGTGQILAAILPLALVAEGGEGKSPSSSWFDCKLIN